MEHFAQGSDTGRYKSVPFDTQNSAPSNSVTRNNPEHLVPRRSEERPEEVLGKIRDLLVGPHEKATESRFLEMINILEEQDTSHGKRIGTLGNGLLELNGVVQKMNTANRALEEQFGQNNLRVDQRLADLQKHVEQLLSAHSQEISAQVVNITESRIEGLKSTIASCQRDVGLLWSALEDHRKSTSAGIEAMNASSLAALEQRLVQARAEREDERSADIKLVADSLMDIGERLAALRARSFRVEFSGGTAQQPALTA